MTSLLEVTVSRAVDILIGSWALSAAFDMPFGKAVLIAIAAVSFVDAGMTRKERR